MISQKQSKAIEIGYYKLRGKAQVARLLCQYLKIKYVDKYYEPDTWKKYTETNRNSMVIKEVPYLKDENFVVTGMFGIIEYILETANRIDMLGKTLKDKIFIDCSKNKIEVKNAILSIICFNKCNGQQKCLQYYFKTKIQPILKAYEEKAKENDWFFGYISLVDFIVYEMTSIVEEKYPQQVKQFKKLNSIRGKVAQLPEVKEYENSERSVKQCCPLEFFKEFKNSRISQSGLSQTTKDSKMDVQ